MSGTAIFQCCSHIHETEKLKKLSFCSTSLCTDILERVCSQTQLCQLRCLMTKLDNYMFRPLLAIFRLSLRELKVLLHNVGARDGEIDRVVFDYIPFPVLTHTTRMTHFQKALMKLWREKWGKSDTGLGEETVKFATACWIQSDREVPLLFSKQWQQQKFNSIQLSFITVPVEQQNGQSWN